MWEIEESCNCEQYPDLSFKYFLKCIVIHEVVLGPQQKFPLLLKTPVIFSPLVHVIFHLVLWLFVNISPGRRWVSFLGI